MNRPDRDDERLVARREQLRSILDALCEGTGVREFNDEDFEVSLDEYPIFVRALDQPPAVMMYREVADKLPCSPAIARMLNEHNATHILFRGTWEDESIFIRADIPADPLVAEQLQLVLESFEKETELLAAKLEDWIE
jgi:hypothetical protein